MTTLCGPLRAERSKSWLSAWMRLQSMAADAPLAATIRDNSRLAAVVLGGGLGLALRRVSWVVVAMSAGWSVRGLEVDDDDGGGGSGSCMGTGRVCRKAGRTGLDRDRTIKYVRAASCNPKLVEVPVREWSVAQAGDVKVAAAWKAVDSQRGQAVEIPSSVPARSHACRCRAPAWCLCHAGTCVHGWYRHFVITRQQLRFRDNRYVF